MDAELYRGPDNITVWLPRDEWEKIKMDKIKTIAFQPDEQLTAEKVKGGLVVEISRKVFNFSRELLH